jgi:glycosyltransferase involved in cell wall biosynthesis
MTIKRKMAVLYGTDFSSIAIGGIQNFIKLLANTEKFADEITYFTLSDADLICKSRNVEVNSTALGKLFRLPNHLAFAISLAKISNKLSNFDTLLLHRPEYALFIRHPRKVLVLHGGTWNAMRAGGFFSGIVHALIEFNAVRKCILVLTVNPKGQSRVSRRLTRREGAIRVPLNSLFSVAEGHRNASVTFSSSRLEPEKRIPSIIDITQEAGLPLKISGVGSLNFDEKFVKILTKSQNVEYLGQRTPEELALMYSEGGYFIALGVAEGYPLACVEAMAAGLQVITLRGLTGISQLEPFGAHVAANEQEIVDFLRAGRRIMSEEQRQLLIREHSPERILEGIWSEIYSDGVEIDDK